MLFKIILSNIEVYKLVLFAIPFKYVIELKAALRHEITSVTPEINVSLAISPQ